ncbi:rhomboid family intramembrane serine protease [Corynebacterium macginleyi]|uniref:rhomboid family intramembrane serine protease n=1 Tax=Corynebacterium macginleyi TaxID=38290 RepID=UPI00190AEFEA|nr:rhomboid family intramembrane serine protease [Corynebacterium macginleyi]MBK4142901.1 rhomboid family intramembrane serine protease [Corynebacterium macginleyi]
MTIGGTSRNRPTPTSTTNRGRGRLSTGLFLALGFLAVEWSVHFINAVVFGGGLSNYGIRPLDVDGLWGIITAPLLHGSLEHLMSNALPGALFCFLIGWSGRRVWWEVTLITTVVAGLGTWLLGGAGTSHIGASGLVYGWLAYLVVRGIFNRSLLQIILGIILGFSYSGLIWGVLPVSEGVSWQGHLFGALGGVLAGMFISSDNPVKAEKK